MARRSWLALVALSLLLIVAPARAAITDESPIAELEAWSETATPRRTIRWFYRECGRGNFEQAARALDLSSLDRERRLVEGPVIARQLFSVLEHKLVLHWDRVSDLVEGDPLDGPGQDVIGSIALGEEKIPIVLTRVSSRGGYEHWVFSEGTVAWTDELHAAYGPGWLADRMPHALVRPRLLGIQAWQWLGILVAGVGAWLGGVLVGGALLRILESIARRTRATWDDAIVARVRGPLRALVAVGAYELLLAPLRLPASAHGLLVRAGTVAALVAVAFLGLRLLDLGAQVFVRVLSARVGDDESRVRGIRTQSAILRRVLGVLLTVVFAALVLSQFEVARRLSTSLLASAGVAGVVIGLAAQRSIAMLLAGIQLSITQPIRIGDAVKIDDQTGTIEEIHLTYVVIEVSEARRYVVPIQRFLDSSFQLWLRSEAPVAVVPIELHAPALTPVEGLRAELRRACEAHPLWDGQVSSLEVSALEPGGLKLRATIGSRDPARNAELRGAVLERLVRFLQENDEGRSLARPSRAA